MMPTTPNREYPYPQNADPATVPAHFEVLVMQLDQDVQQILDMIPRRDELVAIHAGGGSWTITTGLGDPVPVAEMGDGDWRIFL